MKKFVSIVIALVMVLSMTSAFAITDCSVGPFNWDCLSTNFCGKGSVAVVPYVKVNNSCGYSWQESDCAGAVNSERIFFAFELTVEAYPNAVKAGATGQESYWWKEASISASSKGLIAKHEAAVKAIAFDLSGIDWKEDEDVTYVWNKVDSKWVAEDDVEDLDDYIYSAEVADAKKAEVCIKIESDHPGYGEWTYGDYKVVVTDGKITITSDCGNEFAMAWDNEKVARIGASSDAFLKEVQAAFNLGGCVIGTCINDDNIQANFGWDDEQKDCFNWSADAATTVNPECAVTVDIPKTGDVSVVAYAVMAIVAAAGTMLKK